MPINQVNPTPMYGALFMSVILSTALYGVACTQTYFYYLHYQNDPTRTKAFIAVLWAFATIHEALAVSGVFKSIVGGFALSFFNGNPNFLLQFLFTGMASVLSQGYFVYRIYIFSGKKFFVPLIFIVLAIAELATTIIYIAKALAQNSSISELESLDTDIFLDLFTSSLSIAAGVDTLIAISLTFLLVRERRSTSFTRTTHVLQRLIVFSVNTGIWTAVFALLAVVLSYTFPSNMTNAVPGASISVVYLNTVLANLNARKYLGSEATDDFVDADWYVNSDAQSRLAGPGT